MKKSVLFSTLLGAAVLSAAPVSDTTLLRLPPMPKAPVIDGKISPDEWLYASESFGGISDKSGMMTYRENNFRIGCDAENFYVSLSGEMPLPPQMLTSEDKIEIRLQAPGASESVTIVFDSTGKGKLPAGVKVAGGFAPDLVNSFEGKCWNAEAAIPLSALGAKSFTPGEKWGLQIVRHWSSIAEKGYWHKEKTPGELSTFIFDPDAPVFNFDGFGHTGNYRASGNYLWRFRAENPGKKALNLTSGCFRVGTSGAATLDINHPDLIGVEQRHTIGKTMTVEPGKTGLWQLYMMAQFPGKPQFIHGEVHDAAGNLCYRREFFWELGKCRHTAQYKDDRGLPFLSAGFYPSYGNKLRLAATFNAQMPVIMVRFEVKDGAGKVLWKKSRSDFGRVLPSFELETTLPADLPLGDYSVTMTSTTEKGEKFSHTRTFSIRKFAWQGLNLGRERIIVPPFKPLKHDAAKQEVHALLTGYHLNGELWDKVYAEGENILASPVRFTLNGKPFTPGKPKLVSAEKDLIVYETTAEHPQATLKLRHEYDYDGFCLVKMEVIPKGTVTADEFALEIPLKDSVARYMASINNNRPRAQGKTDHSVPSGEGELSMKTITRYPGRWINYIWLGEQYKGFSWIMDVFPVECRIGGKTQGETLTRRNGAVTFKQRFVNIPTEWSKPFHLEMGFEPTPVKPQTGEFRRLTQDMYDYEAAKGSLKCHSPSQWELGYPYPINAVPNNDHSYRKKLLETRGRHTVPKAEREQFASDYMARNGEWIRKNAPLADVTELQRRIARRESYGCDRFLQYHNPAFYSFRWEEAEMYKAEWLPWDYPVDDAQNEYATVMTDEYQDKLLWEMRTQIREMGVEGMNFDCFPLGGGFNTVTNGAVRIWEAPAPFITNTNMLSIASPGIRAADGLLKWRKLMKRTATLLCVEKQMPFGVPWVDLHSSNCEAVPIAAFCTTSITTECGSAGGDYYDRFPESYMLADLVGTQTGLIPRPIVSTQSQKVPIPDQIRSLISWSFAFAAMSHCDQGVRYGYPEYGKARDVVFSFGYGCKENKTLPFYGKEKQPVTCDAKSVRMTQVIRPDGKALLMIGNTGDATQAKFDLSGLNYGKVKITDAMTDKVLAAPEIKLEKLGYALLLIEKQ